MNFQVAVCMQILLCVLLPVSYAEEKSPMYYGWFFKGEIATGIQEITSKHLEKLESDSGVSIFQDFLRNISTMNGIKDPLKYYVKPTDPNTGDLDPDYHVTAHYCGTADCTSYTNKVSKDLGKDFKTEMVGIFFTPRTYGIRIKLSDSQKIIFNTEDTKNPNKNQIEAKNSKTSKVNSGSDLEKEIHQLSSYIISSDYPGIDFIPQDDADFPPTDNKAHVTIGCAPNVSAVTTGDDLMEILKLESNSSAGNICENITTLDGTLVNMGENCDIFVYYLKDKMVASATFQVYYNPSGIESLSISAGLKWVLIFVPIKSFLTWVNIF